MANRDRLSKTDIARQFLAAILAHRDVAPLLSDEHFSVDRTCGRHASLRSGHCGPCPPFRHRGGCRRSGPCPKLARFANFVNPKFALVNKVYKAHFGDRCGIWPAGIDTNYRPPPRITLRRNLTFPFMKSFSGTGKQAKSGFWCPSGRNLNRAD
jgi:hypothetical protein